MLGKCIRRTEVVCRQHTDKYRLKTNGLKPAQTQTLDMCKMTSHICLLILSSLAVSSQQGLEDVFFSPQDQTVKDGDSVFFQCVSGESSHPSSITWLQDGKLVTRGRQIQGEYGGGNQKKTSGTLHLFNVTLEDDGIYICVTHNPILNISKESNPAKLTVQGVPRSLQIMQGPDNITIAMGTEASMYCAVRGFPVPMVHWFKDDGILTNSATFSLHNNGQLLTFRNVSKEDEGFYHCEASNQKETVKSQPAFLLPAEMDWNFIQQPTNLTVKRGENVTLTCRPPYSRPTAQVSWFKNNQLLTPITRINMLPSGDLFFHSVQEFDSGNYFCRASNIHLQRFPTSRRAALTVLAPPTVRVWPQVLTVPVGARVVLECQVSGHPLPSISWIKRGQTKQTGGRIALELRNASLSIQSVQSYDEGLYVCKASNTLGQSQSTAMLRVAVSPIIVTSASEVSCRIGASAILPCRAVGILPITYTWTQDRDETKSLITPTENRHVDEAGALHISDVQQSDAGLYYCTAENRAGRHQRRTVLTVTADDHPIDRGKQTRLVLSASTTTRKDLPISSLSVAEQHAKITHPPHVLAKHKETICSSDCDTTTNRAFASFSRGTVAEGKMPLQSTDLLLQLTTNPAQPLVTQMQPPMLPPPPHPNFQFVALHSQLPVISDPVLVVNSEPTMTQSDSSIVTSEGLTSESQTQLPITSSHLQFHQQVNDELSTEPDSQGSSIRYFYSLAQAQSYLSQTTSQSSSGTMSSSSQAKMQQYETEPHQLVTKSNFSQTYHEPTSVQIIQTKLVQAGQTQKAYPQQSFTQSLYPKFHFEHHLSFTQPPPPSITKPQESQTQGSLMVFEPTATISTLNTFTSPQNQLQSSPTVHPLLYLQTPQPQTESFPLQQKNPPKIHPSSETAHPPDPSLVPEIPVGHQVNVSDQMQLNVSQQGRPVQSAKSTNDTELTEWLKRNTSQSPMTSNDPRVTQQSPSWLPVLEKHDIPIVVGVGVSLAFIFITVTFYSVVQKNEPAPTSRAVQRNLGVPVRHAERRAAGRTYENRAFEDDECVAVIEQSPSTSDTCARPPGPSLVTVQMEPTSENLQEDIPPSLDNHSVTVETYPEPILDTKIDPEEEKGCSLSQPSIQLQCAEEWASSGGDNHSPCQDALPPPSSLPSHSPSPSPPSRREESLRSSLTLQSTEPFVTPIHHSLSISHGNPPLLLSHHVSMGLTTVAVDVHFYPAATASMAVGTSTHISSVSNSTSVTAPLFSPPLSNSQENEQSTGRLHQCK